MYFFGIKSQWVPKKCLIYPPLIQNSNITQDTSCGVNFELRQLHNIFYVGKIRYVPSEQAVQFIVTFEKHI